jgi:hypothetical protein
MSSKINIPRQKEITKLLKCKFIRIDEEKFNQNIIENKIQKFIGKII